MPAALLIALAVAPPGFETRLLSRRTKAVMSAPAGDPAVWKEDVKAVVSRYPVDADFNRMMTSRAEQLARDYYNQDAVDTASFDTQTEAGSLDVSENVEAASPDIISANAGASYYDTGMAHPNSDAHDFFIWSRRLQRLLTQDDVFARPPDTVLRLKAFAAFNNKDAVDANTVKDGIPLAWNSASIGPEGITWTFGPYELGGYASGGSAMIRWLDLKPYLRRDLPFATDAIREVAPTRE